MTTGVNAVFDPDYVPARDRLMPQIVDALQENPEWYAEQDNEATISLVTPLGRFELVVVKSD
jgi:hypothetical protein